MKKFICFLVGLAMITSLIFIFRDYITEIYYDAVKNFSPIDIKLEKNEYYRDYDFNYVQNTADFEPENINDIRNIFYTVINSGQETFSFYCPDEYTNCTEDVKRLANDQEELSHINNFVHPFNGFKHIETQYNSLGEVTITIFKSYDKSMIEAIENKVDSVIASNIPATATDVEKIKIIHDYIINNTRYDVDRSDRNIINYKSDIAYGPLLQGFAICGGYSDAMQIFLERLGIKSYRIASAAHIWNVVYVNGNWYHLDLTWDDPITTDGTQILDNKYFLINTTTLHSLDTTEHIYDKSIYSEAI